MKISKIIIAVSLAVFVVVLAPLSASAASYSVEKPPEGLLLQRNNGSEDSQFYNPYKIGAYFCDPAVSLTLRPLSKNRVDPCYAIQNYDVGFRWGYSIFTAPQENSYQENFVRFWWSNVPQASVNALNIGTNSIGRSGLLDNPQYSFIDIKIMPSYVSSCEGYLDVSCWQSPDGVFLQRAMAPIVGSDNVVAGQAGGGSLFYPLMFNGNVNYPEDYDGYIIPQTVSGDSVSAVDQILNDLNDTDSSGVAAGSLSDAQGWLPPGPVDSLLTLPLVVGSNFLNVLSATDCPVVSFPFSWIGFDMVLPCFRTNEWQSTGFNVVFEFLGGLVSLFLVYSFAHYIFDFWIRMMSLNKLSEYAMGKTGLGGDH